MLNEVREINPDVVWLLENVLMKKEHEDVITRIMGVRPIVINSALVSSQNRNRNYWTNICNAKQGLFDDTICTIPQPADKGILLKHILETNVDEKYYLSSGGMKWLTENMDRLLHKKYASLDPVKAMTLTARAEASWNSNYVTEPVCADSRGCYVNGSRGKKIDGGTHQQLEFRGDAKTNTITSVAKDNLIVQINPSKESGGKQPYQQNRVYDTNGIAPALCSQLSTGGLNILEDVKVTQNYIQWDGGFEQNCWAAFVEGKMCTVRAHQSGGGLKVLEENIVCHNMMPRSSKNGNGGTGHLSKSDGKTYCLDTGRTNSVEVNYRIRRLTPTETCRLQTVDDDFFFHDGKQIVSDSQIYKMLGNGFTVDVIAWILQHEPKLFK